jgi:GMP synthase (glutamine-hydrolysing)
MTFQAASWKDSPGKFVEDTVYELKKLEGKGVATTSGGVDSTVSTALGHLALDGRVHSVHLETGGMRKGECKHIIELLNGSGIPTEFKDYTNKFMPAVIAAGPDSEAKRMAFRDAYFSVAVEEAKKFGARFFIQGTNKADENEVLKKFVKTQNNVVTPEIKERLEKEGLEVVEPVRNIYKNEVRQIARHLGLPLELSERQPFLGPGLYDRKVGQITEENMETMREVDYTASEKLQRFGNQLKEFADKNKQCFAALMDNKTTELDYFPQEVEGVPIDYPRLTTSSVTGLNQKGERAYGRMLLFDSYDTDIDKLTRVSDKILETDAARKLGIVRCATFIDEYANGDFIVPLRAIATTDFNISTALPIRREYLEPIADELTDIPQISSVVYDITHKAPGKATIEYE